MAKFRTVKGGGLAEVPEEVSSSTHSVHQQIVERYKPLTDAMGGEWTPFPDVDPGLVPTGPYVVVQKRQARKRIGSIITAADTQEVDGWNERIGRLIAAGPGCFKDVNGSPAFGVTDGWPKPGDMVRIPSHGGDEYTRKAKNGEDVKLKMFHWRDITGIVQDVTL